MSSTVMSTKSRITNKMGLPQAICDAVSNDGYSRGDADISVTQLIDPPRKVELTRQHEDEITEDASDRIWSLLGQAIHTILERANRVGIAERRLSVFSEGWKVSGGIDLVEEHDALTDYKVTSAWSVKSGIKPEWEAQLNLYAEILRANGHAVKKLKVVCILRDWSKLEAWRDADYAQSQVVTFVVPLWPAETARTYLRERVILHQQARLTLPLCTDAERWAKPAVYAVMKKGKERAVKLYPLLALASSHATVDPNLYVETRPGQNTRCQFYCAAAQFCEQAKRQNKEPLEQANVGVEV